MKFKIYEKMNKSQMVLSAILFIGILSLVSAQVEIGEEPQDLVGAFIEPPEVPSGGGGGGNPFDQSLNTTDDVTFNDLTLTGNYTYVSTYTYEAGLTLNGADTYWKLGQNILSANEGVKMWSDGSIAEFGWSCSRAPPLSICSNNFEIRIAGTPIVTKTFSVSDAVHKFGRGEITFSAGDELAIYYDLVGTGCGASAKAGCGGWIAVYNDDLN